MMNNRIRQDILLLKMTYTSLFDKEWYAKRNGLKAGQNPYKHYLEGGWRNSDPSPFFSNDRYREANLDVKASDVCPLAHYLMNGKREKRSCFVGQVPGKRWRFAADCKQTGEEQDQTEESQQKDRVSQANSDKVSGIQISGNDGIVPDAPLVSVVIPTYNRAKSILESCESVLHQTYKNLELIVVDDCSRDDTEKRVRDIPDHRVRYVRHMKNMGACAARNTGIENAEGEFVAFQDSDDLWTPEKLEIQIKAIKKTGSDICFCRYMQQHEQDMQITGPFYYFEKGVQETLQTVFGIGTQTLVIRREILKEERFDPKMPRFQDLELLIRLAEKYCFYYCDQPMVIYRVGEDSISSNPDKLIRASELLMEKHPEIRKKYPLMARQLAYLLLHDAEGVVEKEKRREMGKLAVRLDPSWQVRKDAWILKSGRRN